MRAHSECKLVSIIWQAVGKKDNPLSPWTRVKSKSGSKRFFKKAMKSACFRSWKSPETILSGTHTPAMDTSVVCCRAGPPAGSEWLLGQTSVLCWPLPRAGWYLYEWEFFAAQGVCSSKPFWASFICSDASENVHVVVFQCRFFNCHCFLTVFPVFWCRCSVDSALLFIINSFAVGNMPENPTPFCVQHCREAVILL